MCFIQRSAWDFNRSRIYSMGEGGGRAGYDILFKMMFFIRVQPVCVASYV